MKLKKIFLFLLFLDLVISLVLKYFSYIGDDSLETKNFILNYFTETDIQTGEEYSRRGFIIKIILEILNSFILFFFVFTKFSIKLEEKISSKFKNPYLILILFLYTIYFIRFLIFIPFDYYFNYYLEHQFGFSKMTHLSYFLYKLKSIGLILFSLALFSGIFLFLLKKFSKIWVFLVPVAQLIISLVMSFLFPILITPLFYKFESLPEGSLKNKIETLSKKVNVNIENIYVIYESEYSSHTNAYFTGFGSNKKIFLYDTLIQNHTEEEIVSVLGHELGHWIYSHQWKDIIISFFEILFFCFLLNYLFFQFKKEQSFHIKEIDSPSSLPILVLVFLLFNSFLEIPWAMLSRSQETEADIYALDITKDRESFIETEIKMAKDNKSRLNPHPFVELYFSHPKTIDRIKLALEYKF